jgi:single-strand DNA-binding protein
MRGVNKVTLIGNATRDAELRQTQTGKPVAHLRLATNRQVGEREVAQFHSIVCWDRLAEQVHQFVKKGDPLYIEGRLEYRTFQDEEGKERGVAEVIASDVQFLSQRSAEQPEPPISEADNLELSLGDIPF